MESRFPGHRGEFLNYPLRKLPTEIASQEYLLSFIKLLPGNCGTAENAGQLTCQRLTASLKFANKVKCQCQTSPSMIRLAFSRLTVVMVETPLSTMVMPNSLSAASMVRLLWVITMNCVR